MDETRRAYPWLSRTAAPGNAFVFQPTEGDAESPRRETLRSCKPRVVGSACFIQVRPAINVRRCFSASATSGSAMLCRSRAIRSSACRNCSTRHVSMMSWLLAPQSTKFAASLSFFATSSVSCFISGIARLPWRAAALESRENQCERNWPGIA